LVVLKGLDFETLRQTQGRYLQNDEVSEVDFSILARSSRTRSDMRWRLLAA
jgi:hypothetical protein